MSADMKRAVAACAWNGILFGVIKLFYELIPPPMYSLLYCTFLGIIVTTAVGAEEKELASYGGCMMIGVAWVMGYVGMEHLFLKAPLPEIVLKAFAFGFMSFVIEVANRLFFGKTGLKYAAIQFSVIIGVFSQQCRQIPYVLAALGIGVVTAILSKKIYAGFERNKGTGITKQ